MVSLTYEDLEEYIDDFFDIEDYEDYETLLDDIQTHFENKYNSGIEKASKDVWEKRKETINETIEEKITNGINGLK